MKKIFRNMGLGILKSRDSLLKKFDEFFNRKKIDSEETSAYLKTLNDTQRRIHSLIRQLNKKVVEGEKKISKEEYEYRFCDAELEKLKELLRKLPGEIRDLDSRKAAASKDICSLLKKNQIMVSNLQKSSDMLYSIDQAIRKTRQEVKEDSKIMKELKIKRKILSQFDWSKDDVFTVKNEVNSFLRSQISVRKMEERKIRSERARLNKSIDNNLIKRILALLN